MLPPRRWNSAEAAAVSPDRFRSPTGYCRLHSRDPTFSSRSNPSASGTGFVASRGDIPAFTNCVFGAPAKEVTWRAKIRELNSRTAASRSPTFSSLTSSSGSRAGFVASRTRSPAFMCNISPREPGVLARELTMWAREPKSWDREPAFRAPEAGDPARDAGSCSGSKRSTGSRAKSVGSRAESFSSRGKSFGSGGESFGSRAKTPASRAKTLPPWSPAAHR